MTPKLIGEMIGIVAIIVSFFIYLSNNRKRIILLKGVSDALWAANSFLLGAFTGGALCLVMVFRAYVFIHRLDKKWAQHRFWLWFFAVMCFVTPIVEILKTGTVALLPFVPVCGSVAAVFGFYDTNLTRIRALNLIGSLLWLTYAIYTNNITLTISGIVSICSILIGAWRAKTGRTPQ